MIMIYNSWKGGGKYNNTENSSEQGHHAAFKHWCIKFGHDFFRFVSFFLKKEILELVVHTNT